VRFIWKYRKAIRLVGLLGIIFGGTLLITGIGFWTGFIDDEGALEGREVLRSLGALIFFPFFVLLFFINIRMLPTWARWKWLVDNMSKEERNKLRAKSELG